MFILLFDLLLSSIQADSDLFLLLILKLYVPLIQIISVCSYLQLVSILTEVHPQVWLTIQIDYHFSFHLELLLYWQAILDFLCFHLLSQMKQPLQFVILAHFLPLKEINHPPQNLFSPNLKVVQD